MLTMLARFLPRKYAFETTTAEKEGEQLSRGPSQQKHKNSPVWRHQHSTRARTLCAQLQTHCKTANEQLQETTIKTTDRSAAATEARARVRVAVAPCPGSGSSFGKLRASRHEQRCESLAYSGPTCRAKGSLASTHPGTGQDKTTSLKQCGDQQDRNTNCQR